jgi:hypothetical protein
MPLVRRFLPLLAALCLAVLSVSACDSSSGDDQPQGTVRATTASSLAVTDVVCPKDDVNEQDTVPFRADDRRASPRMVASMTLHHLGAGDSRNYCVDAYVEETTPQKTAQRITSYTVTAAPDGADYGQSYTTSDRTGSDELLNFPFAFHTNGKCRPVTAKIVVTDQGSTYSYSAATHAGPHCA